MEESQRILKLAVSVGETLLKNGGEIYRVQETIGRILSSFGIHDYNVFVVSNGIFATIHEDRPDRGSMVRNVPLGAVNLNVVTDMNQLSREICAGQCSLEEAYERLAECRRKQGVGRIGKMLAGGLGCASFGYIYECGPMECFVAFLLGILLQLFVMAAGSAGLSKFIVNIIGSALASAISFSLAAAGVPLMYDKAVIGAIVLLVPGVALTTSIREMFNGDYLSGSIHLADALMTAACIAVGVGASVKIFQLLGGVL